jgi:hypothetical protein
MQPEDEQAAAVVSVRGASLREARVGLLLSLCLLVALAATHPNWKVVATFVVVQGVAAVYTGIKAAFKFRRRLDDVEALPTEAVEAFGRPKRSPISRKVAAARAAAIIAASAGAIVIGWNESAPHAVAAVMALLIADGLVRPLATAYLATRWERAHGRARLFRPLVRDMKGTETLYVADRSVPAA